MIDLCALDIWLNFYRFTDGMQLVLDAPLDLRHRVFGNPKKNKNAMYLTVTYFAFHFFRLLQGKKIL